MCGNLSFNVKIADLYLRFLSQTSRIKFDTHNSLVYYSSSCVDQKNNYILEFIEDDGFVPDQYKLVFVGEPEYNFILNYKWTIYSTGVNVYINVEFNDHDSLKGISAEFFPDRNKVLVRVCFKEDVTSNINIDPLMHPLGSLIMLYLLHWNQGLLIHASAVKNDNKAFLFTGVSGIGKSTMARLWHECGADVLNDDRLVLRLIDGAVNVYNNPMPYYPQKPVDALLDKIFILKQSPDNYIKPLSGIQAYSKILGNFIQQFYQKEMVQKHLNLVELILDKVQVYEVGFKPDHDIVEMIKNVE